MSTEGRVGGFFALCALVLIWILLLETTDYALAGVVTLIGLVVMAEMVSRRL